MMDNFKRESDILSCSPPNPEFPDMDTLISMMTKNMPKSDLERIKKMIDMLKMMEMMEKMPGNSNSDCECQGEPDRVHKNESRTPPPGFNSEMIKRMMSPKQQEMFEKYQDMFKYE